MTPAMLSLQASVSGLIEAEGLRPLADRLGVGVGDLRSIRDGRGSRAPTIARVCAALGLEFYIGPPREGGVPWGPLAISAGLPEIAAERLTWIAADFEELGPREREEYAALFRGFHARLQDEFRRRSRPEPAPARPATESPAGMAPVSDRRIAEVLAVLADTFEELNERGREDLIAHFWAFNPALRERERSLARVVAWLGWRTVEGRANESERVSERVKR